MLACSHGGHFAFCLYGLRQPFIWFAGAACIRIGACVDICTHVGLFPWRPFCFLPLGFEASIYLVCRCCIYTYRYMCRHTYRYMCRHTHRYSRTCTCTRTPYYVQVAGWIPCVPSGLHPRTYMYICTFMYTFLYVPMAAILPFAFRI
jgi:hypothetical protein